MEEDERARLVRRIEDLEVKLGVIDGIIVEVIAPVVSDVPTSNMIELINAIRTDLTVKGPERLKAVGGSYIRDFASRLEARILGKTEETPRRLNMN